MSEFALQIDDLKKNQKDRLNKYIYKNNLDQNLHLKDLGPEPLDKKFNFRYFKKYIIGRNRKIKDIFSY